MRYRRAGLLFVFCLLAGVLAGHVTAQETRGALEIHLASPGEGEIFYAAPDGVLTSVPLSGQVVSYDTPVDLETIELTLTFVGADGEGPVEMRVPVAEDGTFFVWATINPYNSLPTIEIHEEDLCLSCHRYGEVTMPLDVTQLLVHARTPDGLTGSAVRQIRLDRGQFQALEVQVAGLPESDAAAQVTARTTVYEWRPRTFFASVAAGQTVVEIERLVYTDLAYEIMLTPLVVGDTRYEADPQTLILPAGGGVLPPVTLIARPVRGTITGRVVAGGAGVEAATILAVDLGTGASRTTTTAADGAFGLADLPVSEHVLLAESSAGVHVPGRYDLREEVAPEIVVHLARGGPEVLRGQIMLGDEPLPFAQAEVEGLLPAQADPLSGTFAVAAVPAGEPLDLTITAAGCYSAQRRVSARDLGAVQMSLLPDTTVLDRDRMRLFLPAATQVTRQGDELDLVRGVLWARSEAGVKGPGLALVVGDYRLTGAGASFAVEALAGALPRLYVRAGTVNAAFREEEPVPVHAGETLTLSGATPRPVELAPGAGVLLRTAGGSAGRFVRQPDASEQALAALWQGVEGAARVLMLGAYAITFAGLPALLLATGVVWWRRRRTGADSI